MVFARLIQGQSAESPRKNGWTLSERAGHVTADRMQWLLNGSVWDADRLRDAVRDCWCTPWRVVLSGSAIGVATGCSGRPFAMP